MTGWPDPNRPGVPLNPEQDGLHYITDGVALWDAWRQRWSLLCRARQETAEWLAQQPWAEYRGPCPTPNELAARERAAYKRGWEDREGDFLAGVERTGLVAMGPDTLAVTLGDAYRAGAEAMREACAAEVDCGCAARKDVLAAMERGGTPRPEWLCPIGGNCYATMAQTLRELPLVAMPDPPHDSPAKPGH
jgi:hypothetical protein